MRSAGMSQSPYDSPQPLTASGIASLSLGLDVHGLTDPIEFRMPLASTTSVSVAPASALAAANSSGKARNASASRVNSTVQSSAAATAAAVSTTAVAPVDTCQYWDYEQQAPLHTTPQIPNHHLILNPTNGKFVCQNLSSSLHPYLLK